MKNLGFRNTMIFIILSATVALAYQLPYMRFTFYDQMMAALQINDTQMGLLASALAFTLTISYIIGGFFANKFSMRSLILVTLAAFIILPVCFAFTTNFYLLMGIQVLFGFFGVATMWSAYLSGLRGLGDESIQSKLFGWSESTRGIIQSLTGFVYIAIMGVAATPVLGFRYVMIFGAGVVAVIFILAFIFLPKEKKTETNNTQEQNPKAKINYVHVIKDKGVWLTILLIVCAFTSWITVNNYVTTYTVRVLGISDSLASTIGVVRSYVIVLLAGFFGGWLLDKFTYKGKGFMVLFSITAVVIASIFITNKIIPLCIGVTLLIAFLANVMKSTYWSVMSQAGISPEMTPLATGFISFIAFLPEAITPIIFGRWLDIATAAGNVAAGFNKIFIVMIIFAVIGIGAGFILMQRTKKLETENKIQS